MSRTSCHTCAGRPKKSLRGFGLMAGFLLALLPKCPFCVLAFTSTALLCGEGKVISSSTTHYSPVTIWIAVILCVLAITGILLNFRGRRTLYAAGVAIIGTLVILYTVLEGGGQLLYYTGTTILFFAVWMNGSLMWLLRKLAGNVPSGKETSLFVPKSERPPVRDLKR